MQRILLILLICFSTEVSAQQISAKLNTAYKNLISDNSLKHGLVSFYVADSKTGKIIFSRNEQTGMPAGSVQKVFTSIAVLDLLGLDYNYKTDFYYNGDITGNTLRGNILVKGSYDPSFGSPRFSFTTPRAVLNAVHTALKQKGIDTVNGGVYVYDDISSEKIPDRWIWQDLGTYYGAAPSLLNWRENQYDLILRSGKKGDSVSVVNTEPGLYNFSLRSMAVAASKGTGDNTYIFFPLAGGTAIIRGTIPEQEKKFVVAGSIPDPPSQFAYELSRTLRGNLQPVRVVASDPLTLFYEHTSPEMDSLVYWFLQRSINLYGESLLRTVGIKYTNSSSTDSGVSVIKNFWKERGIENSALHIYDGSGLSPENRVTAYSLVTAMQYALRQKWFGSFNNALPVINKLKMKSGTIGGAVAYTGYCTSSSGQQYTFAVIANNFDGSVQSMREKIWKLLDNLK